MNTTQPRSRVCACGTSFELTQRNQRYCPTCRERRTEAMEVLKNRVCRHCQAEKATVKHGICPDCREADRNRRDAESERIHTAKLARINAKGGCTCGQPATNPHDGLCAECHTKRMDDMRQRIRQKRSDDSDKRREEQAAESAAQAPQGDDFMTWFESLPDDDQEYALNSLKDYAAMLGVRAGTDSPPTVEATTNPEEIPHDNQAAIDAAFASLLADMEL